MIEVEWLEWIPTGNPNVIAASGYPVQIERAPQTGDFIVSGYGHSAHCPTFEYAKLIARGWVSEQNAFNKIAGVEK